jgi:opine dehydrogenase
VRGNSSFEIFNTLWTHKWEVPATSMKYEVEQGELAESLPYYFIPFIHLGHALGVPTPAHDTMINLAELVTGKDYRREGVSLNNMGLDGMTAQQIIRYVNTGEK